MKRKWIIIVLLIIATGAFASNYGGSVPYILFYFSILLPLSSLVYIIYVVTHFKYYQEVGARTIVKGEPSDFIFSLCNEDKFMYSSIKVKFLSGKSKILNKSLEREYSVLPHETQKVKTKICCFYRGEYYVGAEKFLISDYLNFFHYEYKVDSMLKVMVMPRLINMHHDNFILEDEDEKKSINKKGMDELDNFLSKYVKGDSLKQINFKVSAKTGILYKRPYKSIEKGGILVAVDLSAVTNKDKKIAIEDAIIEESLSIINYCFMKNIKVTVLFCQDSIISYDVNNTSDFDKIYNLFAKVRFESKVSVDDFVLKMDSYIVSGQYRQAILVTDKINNNIYVNLKRNKENIKESVLLIDNLKSSQSQIISGIKSDNIDIREVAIVEQYEDNL